MHKYLPSPELTATWIVRIFTYGVVWLCSYGFLTLLGEPPRTLIEYIGLSAGAFFLWAQWDIAADRTR